MNPDFDVVVIGGGAAGLSAATALARSRRSVLVVDAGDPRNAVASHVHNLFSRDGAAPAELYEVARAELRGYGGEVVEARVENLSRHDGAFVVTLTDRQVTARRLLAATGTRDELPDIAGLAARWGVDVLHCPYCHGWEVRDQRIGVLVTGPMATHQALLFRQLSADVTVLEHTGPALVSDQQQQLDALGIATVAGEVVEVVSGASGLTGVRLADGSVFDLDALVVAPPARARAEVLAPLGVEPVEVRFGEHVLGTQLEVDETGATSVPGLWAAGNVADVRAQVVGSAAAGLVAGAAINADLIAEDTARAVAVHREATLNSETSWDERYSGSERIWSGEPNGALVAEVADLPAGRALDVGCGEGADAVWLARRGWAVTALDVSAVALARAARHAHEAGADVTWVRSELTPAAAPAGAFDLVTAQYPALLRTPDHSAERALIEAVAPGGVLLVVHHDLFQPEGREHAHGLDPADFVGPYEVAALLDDSWLIEVDEHRDRHVTTGAGAGHSRDVVLRARRR